MNLEIIPYISVGEIKMDEERSLVRNKFLKGHHREFRKSEFSANTTDIFHQFIFVYYSVEDKVECVEIANEEGLCVTFLGQNIFSLSYKEFKSFLQNATSDIKEDESGFECYKYGIAIYAPEKNEDENCKIEAALAFKKGYYD